VWQPQRTARSNTRDGSSAENSCQSRQQACSRPQSAGTPATAARRVRLQTAQPPVRLAQLGAARRSRHRPARGRKAWTSSQHVRMLASHHSATVHMHDRRLSGHAAALEIHFLKIKNRRSRTRFAFGGRRRRAAASTSRTRRSWCSWSASAVSTTCTPRWDLQGFAMVLVCSTFCRCLGSSLQKRSGERQTDALIIPGKHMSLTSDLLHLACK